MTNNEIPANGQPLKPIAWLNNSRILAIFVVILAHSADVVIVTNQIGTYNWWVGNVYDILGRWSVPVFVMVSGALLLNPSRKENLNTFYQKRLSRILLPILFWSAIYILITVRFGEYWLGYSPSISLILMDLAAGKPFFHLWFLYMILGLYLFTPFLRKIVENTTRKELKLFVILCFSAAMINFAYTEIFSTVEQPKTFITLFLEYVPFFFAGYLIKTSDVRPNKLILWAIIIFSITFSVAGRYFFGLHKNINLGYYIFDSLSITLVPMSISIMLLLKSWVKPIINTRFTSKLASLTLGIYVIHPLVWIFVYYLGYDGTNVTQPIISIPIIAAGGYILSMLVTWFISGIPILKRII